MPERGTEAIDVQFPASPSEHPIKFIKSYQD